MITQMKASNVLGAKTARACDSCLRRRARWFCAADDAFLCHVCDNSVHSANQLASRHERVRLQTASSSKANCSWHSGFTRKARTPRHNKHLSLQQQRPKHEEEEERVLFSNINSLPVVPELGGEETVLDESDEQLLFRVPVFDPFEAELCNIYSEVGDERLKTAVKNDAEDEGTCGLDNFSEFLPSDMDLADFSADVKSLLGGKLDEGSGEMTGSEVLFDCKQEDDIDAYLGAKSAMVKVKDEEVEGVSDCHLDSVLDITSDALNWDIDSESPAAAAQKEEEEKVVVPVAANYSGSSKVGTKRKVFLRLNYEDVISAWATQGSPWTIGIPPDFNSDDCWLGFSGWSGGDVECFNGEVGSLKGGVLLLGSKDEGREARVTRYREKRRTRLFAKKIRYQVRKLNAEKRPRMKGRFVKRTSLLGTTAFPNYL